MIIKLIKTIINRYPDWQDLIILELGKYLQ